LLQILLVDGQLLGDLGAGLSGKEVLELDVKLLLLLDGHVFLDNLLRFLDQTLLECLNLEQELKGVGVSALKLSPSMVVERVLKLFGEGLDLEALLLESVTETEDFFLVLGDLGGLCLLNLELTLVLADLVTKQLDVFKTLVVLHLTLAECDLQDLDLLVEESQLIVSTDKLRAENVSLSHQRGIGLPGQLMLVDGLLDDAVELGDFATLFTHNVFSLALLLGFLLVTLLEGLELLGFETVLMMLSREGLILGVDLVLELSNLVLGNTELLSKLNNLIVGNDKVLTVEVTVRSHDFVQVLLLLKLALKLDVLFLELTDQIALQLYLFDHLHKVGVGFVGGLRLLLLLGFNLSDRLDQTLDVILVAVVLFLERVDNLVLTSHSLLVLVVVLLHLEEGGLEHVTIALELHDASLLILCLLVEPVEVTDQVAHVALSVLFLANSVVLL